MDQVILAIAPKENSLKGILVIEETGEVLPCVFGEMGLTLNKKEGDLKTPLGTFPLSSVFGKEKPHEITMPFIKTSGHLICVDDPKSRSYQKIIDVREVGQDWESFEEMYREDNLYDLGVVIDSPQGSCLFIHIWRGKDSGTKGCIGLKRSDLERLIAYLKAGKHPKIEILIDQSLFNSLLSEKERRSTVSKLTTAINPDGKKEPDLTKR